MYVQLIVNKLYDQWSLQSLKSKKRLNSHKLNMNIQLVDIRPIV